MWADEKFRLGQRVQVSAKGKERFKDRSTPGTIVGFSKKSKRLIRVVRQERKTPVLYHMDFWEPME
jgi:hypothetical protein